MDELAKTEAQFGRAWDRTVRPPSDFMLPAQAPPRLRVPPPTDRHAPGRITVQQRSAAKIRAAQITQSLAEADVRAAFNAVNVPASPEKVRQIIALVESAKKRGLTSARSSRLGNLVLALAHEVEWPKAPANQVRLIVTLLATVFAPARFPESSDPELAVQRWLAERGWMLQWKFGQGL